MLSIQMRSAHRGNAWWLVVLLLVMTAVPSSRCESISSLVCLSSPCVNGGSCFPPQNGEPGTFACSCVAGFTGSACDQIEDACTSSPCLHSGTCSWSILSPSSMVCTCPIGVTGSFCESDMATAGACSSNPCYNGGSCVAATSSQSNSQLLFTCLCAKDYTGPTCRQHVDKCLSSPCSNGGTCIQNDATQTQQCFCTTWYTGASCAERLDQCLSDPCANGGTCLTSDGYTFQSCSCRTGYSGAFCEAVTNDYVVSKQVTFDTGTTEMISSDFKTAIQIDTAFLTEPNVTIAISETHGNLSVELDTLNLLSTPYTFLPHQPSLFSECQSLAIHFDASLLRPGWQVVVLRMDNESATEIMQLNTTVDLNTQTAKVCVNGFSVFMVSQVEQSEYQVSPDTVAIAVGVTMGVVSCVVLVALMAIFVVRFRRRNMNVVTMSGDSVMGITMPNGATLTCSTV